MHRLRNEQGMTLIELLIAMVVMAVGITAIVAGLVSGVFTIERSAKTTSAGTLADQKVESLRQSGYSSLTVAPQTSTTAVGSDGNSYWIGTTVSWTCVIGPAQTTTSATPPTCSGTPASRPVKLVDIQVRDLSATGKLRVTESATFDSSMG
jgi:prepilin-type N-terminal cleavage/methylation domain-containing protein